MKNLTTNQQEIIDSIVSEFNRINTSSASEPRSFNLIDLDPLMEKTNEIKRNKQIAEDDRKRWWKIAMDEALRIAKLLQADLPNACVERFGKSNGKHEEPSVIIQRESGICGHHDNYVCFSVKVVIEWVKQSHDCAYEKGIGLSYGYYNNIYKATYYDTIEELFEKSRIKEEIRFKIIR